MKQYIEQFKNINFADFGNAPPLPKLVALILLLVATVVAGVIAFLVPQQDEIDKAKKEEETLKNEFRDKKKQAVNLPELKKQLLLVGQYVSALEKQLPSRAEMDALLTDINQAGLGRGLQFELFQPGNVNVKQYYAELPISVQVSGSYHDLGAFASDIANLSRIVTLNDMNISTRTDSKGGAGGLQMRATAKTFRYLDNDEVANQRKSGGAKK